jgi:tetratricopeptide (TPR) repeat protein
MRLTARDCVGGGVLALLAITPAIGQLTDEIPHASYYAGVQAFYAGEYRTAERELRRETARGVRTTQSRWIDSICYHAALGEVLYHEGRNADALGEFDQAAQLFLAYPNWLLQVRFQAANGPRPDTNRARRAPPWGQSGRNFVLGQFPQTESILIGDLNANQAYSAGGVVREPMYWKVNVVEIMRMTALTIRRRNELLGPLAPHDSISKELSVVLARNNLAPANHWSQTWIEILRGLAQEGMGRLDEADALLGKSLVIQGQLDHPLTGIALLEQGRIAMMKGDTRKAGQLLAEAGFSGFNYDDYGVVTDSAMNGWLNFAGSGASGVYPALEPIAAWAQASRLQHTAIKLRLAQVEGLLFQGQLAAGLAILDDVGRHLGEMKGSVPAVEQLYLQGIVHLMQGKAEAGGETLNKALNAQSNVSLRNFQIERTNQMYDSRVASARLAVDFYKSLLADPSANDWVRDPLDSMAALGTDQTVAFDRWFVAALERKDAAMALEIAERAKRRQYLASQPLGGRLLELRAILESPVSSLTPEAAQNRQRILASFGEYQKLVDAGQKIHDQLVTTPILASSSSETKTLSPQYDAWNRNAIERQQMLIQIAVRRLPSSCEFPPLLATTDLQKALGKGETLVEFHSAAGALYGFVVTATDAHIWQLPDTKRLKNGLASFLKALGNYGANRQLSITELKGDSWRELSAQADVALFGDARLDLAKTTSLVIVPDDLLWYVPFEVLTPGGANAKKVLGELFPIRYGPTGGLAVARSQPMRRPQHAGIVANDLKFAGDENDRAALVQELTSDLTGPVVLGENLSQPGNLIVSLLDQLIVMDDLPPNAEVGEAATLLPRSRGAGKDSLNNWILLPFGGPQQIVLTGVATEAEQGLKTSRRGAKHARPGAEIFDSLCDLMAGGARTILMTRWRTGGRTNFDLVHEFARESANAPAADAWQRACLLARESPLDASREPRLKKSDETVELPTADHPFFWAGYLLVDTGPRPEVQNPPPAESSKPDAKKADGAKPDAAKGDKLPPPDKPKTGDEKPAGDMPKKDTDSPTKANELNSSQAATPPANPDSKP